MFFSKIYEDDKVKRHGCFPVLAALMSVVLAMTAITGCGAGKETEQEQTVIVPLVDEYDKDMSMAHFISAPDVADEMASTRVEEYEASFTMAIDGTEASFVLGDAIGEYGRLSLYGIRATEGGEFFTFRSFDGGVEDEDYKTELPINAADSDEYRSYGVYRVRMAVNGDRAAITVNDEDLGEVTVPQFGLGCVGTYKSRGTDVAYMDDISVSANGQELFAEDFDGNFINNLYGYDYARSQGSAFDPYYYKAMYDTKGRSLVVSSGFLLSETVKDAAPVFKRNFEADNRNVESAYLYMTALGSFDVHINGQKVSEHYFDPGKMVFDQYLNYVSYDVTELIEAENEIEIDLFHGFFDRGVGYPEVASPWGERLAVKGELVVNYKDGTRDIIPTDESFLVSRGSRYRFDDIYQGEIIDDRYDVGAADFYAPLVDAVEDKFINAKIRHKENGSISAWNKLCVVSVTEPETGHFVYDFGRNIAGTVVIDKDKLCEAVGLKDGDVLTFRYGEILNDSRLVNSDNVDGTVWTKGLLTARSTDYYVYGAASPAKDICFGHTYHGFRYMEVTGIDSAIPEDAITALALSSEMEQTGDFHCSNDVINALYQNSIYSLRANMMDNPTDCAQRDERLGWSGDAQAASGFAMYQYDSESFYRNYLRELRAQQEGNGIISDVAPSNNPFGGHSCWGDSIAEITWNAYLQYGDITIIADNMDAAERWVNYLIDASDDYLLSSGGYGDHLSGQSTPEALTDTAWAAHSARLVANMHRVREDKNLTEIYDDYADRFTRKWQETFIREDGSVAAGILNSEVESETAYALGIAFDLFPEDMKQDAAERLNILSEYGAYLFYPGYAGMANYLPALSRNGYADTAIRVMTNAAPGGYAHPLSLGLTTNPEDLHVFRYQDKNGNEYPDGKYEITGSLNHAAYSSVCAFCYSDILGIRPDEKAPGYEHFFVKPMMAQGVTSAEGSYRSRHGLIKVAWNSEAKEISCTVPEGTTCTLTLPTGETQELEAGEHVVNW